jgi:hypothetical protein
MKIQQHAARKELMVFRGRWQGEIVCRPPALWLSASVTDLLIGRWSPAAILAQ